MKLDEKEIHEYLESFNKHLESINANTSAIREGIGTIQEKFEEIEYALGPREHEMDGLMSSIVVSLHEIKEAIRGYQPYSLWLTNDSTSREGNGCVASATPSRTSI